MRTHYPAKVLLFGEHTVLRGGRGLAIPYPALSLYWATGAPDERLLALADYLAASPLTEYVDASALREALRGGAVLASDIPTGYGLGSSGAVCAAVWDRFATTAGRRLAGADLRAAFATLEARFHGESSGTDPLICYLGQPLLLGGGQPPAPVELPSDWATGFFLVDSGQPRSAADYINVFLSRHDAGWADSIAAEWRQPADRAIAALLAGDQAALLRETTRVSRYQRAAFPNFIPHSLLPRWSSDHHALKLCGAGGGGMMLGLSTDRAATARVFPGARWLADH